MEEKVKVSILLSVYGNLLTETQKKYMELYYNEDYSLSEIGENESITRQAVRTILVKSKNKLEEYESLLGFLEKEENIRNKINVFEKGNLSIEQKKILEDIISELDF